MTEQGESDRAEGRWQKKRMMTEHKEDGREMGRRQSTGKMVERERR